MIQITNLDLSAMIIAAKYWFRKQSLEENDVFDLAAKDCEKLKKELAELKAEELMIDIMPF